MPADVDPTLPLPGLSPVRGKPLIARFDGGRLSSDGGVLLLAEVERRLGIADRLARCIEDPRAPVSWSRKPGQEVSLDNSPRRFARLMLVTQVRA